MADFSENFSHEVKATEVELHYNDRISRAEVHKAGCKHHSDSPKRPLDLATVGADDYFWVAPCARRR